MVSGVKNAAAPYGSIGGHAFVSAKQAQIVEKALAGAANSGIQKANDAAATRLTTAVAAAVPTPTSAAVATASAAVTAQSATQTASQTLDRATAAYSTFNKASTRGTSVNAVG